MGNDNVTPLKLDGARSDELRERVVAGTLNRLTQDDWALVLEHAEVREYHYNQVILGQGRLGTGLWVISDGEVRIERDSRGATIQLARLGPGSVFGEMSFLDETGASTSVVADGRVDLLYLDGTEPHTLADRDFGFAARFYHSLAATLSRRLRATNETIRGRPD